MVIVTCLYPQKTAICPFVRLSVCPIFGQMTLFYTICPFVPLSPFL